MLCCVALPLRSSIKTLHGTILFLAWTPCKTCANHPSTGPHLYSLFPAASDPLCTGLHRRLCLAPAPETWKEHPQAALPCVRLRVCVCVCVDVWCGVVVGSRPPTLFCGACRWDSPHAHLPKSARAIANPIACWSSS
eukprot:GGOE01030969.1.p6 GENE.GGOE01030969.1~~GGOE01030969.1.p6  ORF type:complete len:137 (-),score=8.17 GGOE01030969.1:652-1062(-)